MCYTSWNDADRGYEVVHETSPPSNIALCPECNKLEEELMEYSSLDERYDGDFR